MLGRRRRRLLSRSSPVGLVRLSLRLSQLASLEDAIIEKKKKKKKLKKGRRKLKPSGQLCRCVLLLLRQCCRCHRSSLMDCLEWKRCYHHHHHRFHLGFSFFFFFFSSSSRYIEHRCWPSITMVSEQKTQRGKGEGDDSNSCCFCCCCCCCWLNKIKKKTLLLPSFSRFFLLSLSLSSLFCCCCALAAD